MGFQLSPGVNITEIDLTTVVPSVLTTAGAFAGAFKWGPADQITLIDSELTLRKVYGTPDNNTYVPYFTASSFLAYGNNLSVARAANVNSLNSTTQAPPTLGYGITVRTAETDAEIVVSAAETTYDFTVTANTVDVNMVVDITVPAGDYTVGETVFQGISVPLATASGEVLSWSNTTGALSVTLIGGSFTPNTNITGETSGTIYNLTTVTGVVSGPIANYTVGEVVYEGAAANTASATAVVRSWDSANAAGVLAGVTGTLSLATWLKGDTSGANNNLVSANAVSIVENYTVGETVYQGANLGSATASGAVENWVSANSYLVLNNINGTFAANNYLYGNTSGANNRLVSVVSHAGDIYPYNVGEVVYQGADLASATFTGVVTSFSGTSANLNQYITGSFSANTNLIGATSGNVNVLTSNTAYLAASNTAHVENEVVFGYTLLNSNNGNEYGPFMGRYNGALGNSIEVSVCANTNAFATWDYANYFTGAPNTSEYAAQFNSDANDELHVVVIDSQGLFSGSKGTVLETYPFVSKAYDAILNGGTNYYKQVIFNQSKYIYAVDPIDYTNTVSTWGTPANLGTTYLGGDQLVQVACVGGTDASISDGDLIRAFNKFADKETTDISLVISGDANVNVQQHIIDGIVNTRKDCVAFISPPAGDVINQAGLEQDNIKDWLNVQLQRDSSYVVADSGWKYMFDVYNNVYRWIPLNADIAGLCVYTDGVRDPWYSPAGFNRGQIRNAIKLAWNPNKTQRDVLYSNGVNPVVSFPGQGIVLYGDKTLQAKPSAFDHINVRRLFIVLEKAISTAAQYSLFEFNDEFTRAQFVALVTPYLRDVQGRRGITDFKVVCDTTNNTQQVIDTNQFVGDIYIKPSRSINYIQLNFVAVGTGVDFSTIVGVANP